MSKRVKENQDSETLSVNIWDRRAAVLLLE